MKGNKLKLLYVAAFALVFSACSDDEDGGGGNLTQPVTFASSIQALEDSEENEGWSETLDPRVAVRADGEVKRYQTDTEGKLTSSDPFYWEGRSSLTVDAWYPYNNGVYQEEVVVKANQSTPSLFQQSNLMEVIGAEVTPDNPSLTFVHRTVRVACNLTLPASAAKTRTEGNPFAGATVTLLNINGVEQGNRVRTSPNRAAYIPPQTIPAGTEFIEITYADGRTTVITLTSDYSATAGQKTEIAVETDPETGQALIYIDNYPSWDGSEDFIDVNDPTINAGGNGSWGTGTDGGSLDGNSSQSTPDGSGSWGEGTDGGSLNGSSDQANPDGSGSWGTSTDGGDLDGNSSQANPDGNGSWNGADGGNLDGSSDEANPDGSGSWNENQGEDLEGDSDQATPDGNGSWTGSDEGLDGNSSQANPDGGNSSWTGNDEELDGNSGTPDTDASGSWDDKKEEELTGTKEEAETGETTQSSASSTQTTKTTLK